MKTINFELSKRLNDLWLLDDIETEYFYRTWDNVLYNWNPWDWPNWIKTLTLEEAIEFLPDWYMVLKNNWKFIIENLNDYINPLYKWKHFNTLLEAIEDRIEYLLDNNLLIK